MVIIFYTFDEKSLMHRLKSFITLVIFFYSYLLFAQNDHWTSVVVDDSILVDYRLTDTILDGKSHQMLVYNAKCTSDVDYERCVHVFEDLDNFTKIFDYTKRSEKREELAQNEWLIYLYLDMPWPMPNSDMVYTMNFTRQDSNNTTIITMISSPDMLEPTDVERGRVGNSVYTISKLENGKVMINISTLSVPSTEAPDWMAKAWFPNGPAKIMRNIMLLSTAKY